VKKVGNPVKDICIQEGSAFFCKDSPCQEGQGKCSQDSECSGDLVCGSNGICASKPACSVAAKCAAGAGVCSLDSHCQVGLFCVVGVGNYFGLAATDGVCLENGSPHFCAGNRQCRNGEYPCQLDSMCTGKCISGVCSTKTPFLFWDFESETITPAKAQTVKLSVENNAVISQVNINYEGGTDADRKCEITNDPKNAQNKVLLFWMKKAAITTGYSFSKGRIASQIHVRTPNMKEALGDVKSGILRTKLFLHSDFEKYQQFKEENSWFTINEFWIGSQVRTLYFLFFSFLLLQYFFFALF
jgi:hypothetical protein